jgi:hypothetical protein
MHRYRIFEAGGLGARLLTGPMQRTSDPRSSATGIASVRQEPGRSRFVESTSAPRASSGTRATRIRRRCRKEVAMNWKRARLRPGPVRRHSGGGLSVRVRRRVPQRPGGIALLISYPLNVLAMGQAVAAWAQGLLVLAVAVAVGVPAGVRLRSRSQNSANFKSSSVTASDTRSCHDGPHEEAISTARARPS